MFTRNALVGLVLAWVCLMGAFCPAARAWNPTGHMAVAGVAYDHLTPRAKAGVDALLARHRDYALWMRDLPAGDTDRARYAFLRAAVWPDDVRHTPDDRPTWHYTDTPVVVPGYKADPDGLLPARVSAETQLPIEVRLLKNKTAADPARATALCWVEHLVGDVHQPLHDASLISATFPQGDKGGNSELLAPDAVTGDPREEAANPKNLHALWDDLLGETRDPTQIAVIVAALETPAFAPSTYPQLTGQQTVQAWVLEGFRLARDVVYLGGKLPSKPDGTKADVTLPPGYLATAHQVADRQVALAGLRLAGLLNGIAFPPVKSAPPVIAPPSVVVPPTVTPPPSPPIMASGPIIGNRRTHVYHRPGEEGTLPSERNRVYFQTEDAAMKAGYHAMGTASQH
jgi:hypothetical protein